MPTRSSRVLRQAAQGLPPRSGHPPRAGRLQVQVLHERGDGTVRINLKALLQELFYLPQMWQRSNLSRWLVVVQKLSEN